MTLLMILRVLLIATVVAIYNSHLQVQAGKRNFKNIYRKAVTIIESDTLKTDTLNNHYISRHGKGRK